MNTSALKATLDAGEEVRMYGFILSNTGLRPDPKKPPTSDDYEKMGRFLAWFHEAGPWLIGDWVAYGEGVYGEKAAQAVAASGLKLETVTNYAWVARKVPPGQRDADARVTFSHHKEVADLPAKEQKAWLKKAKAGDEGAGWTVGRLRREINAVKKPEKTECWVLVLCSNANDRERLIARMEKEGRTVKVP